MCNTFPDRIELENNQMTRIKGLPYKNPVILPIDSEVVSAKVSLHVMVPGIRFCIIQNAFGSYYDVVMFGFYRYSTNESNLRTIIIQLVRSNDFRVYDNICKNWSKMLFSKRILF